MKLTKQAQIFFLHSEEDKLHLYHNVATQPGAMTPKRARRIIQQQLKC